MLVSKMFTSIDSHVLGEVFRIVVQSPIQLSHNDIHQNNEELQHNFSNEKHLLLNEPRGHRGINGCLISPSKTANYQLLFFNHKNVSAFKYEGLAASLTALLETGNIARTKDDIYHIETINGIYTVKANMVNSEVISIQLENKNSRMIETYKDYKKVNVDNDRTYLVFELPSHITSIDITNLEEITTWGGEKTSQCHKQNEDFEGIILVEQRTSNSFTSVTFEKDGYIKRSPGIDSTVAIFTSKDGDSSMNIENKTIFNSKLVATKVDGNSGKYYLQFRPFVTGSHQFVFDHDDPLKNGFLLK